MPSKSPIQLWLALKAIPRLSINKKLQLVEHCGIEALFNNKIPLSTLSLTAKQQAAIQAPNWQAIDQIIADSHACQSEIIPYDDARYSRLLKEIHDPPLVLFVQGNLTLLNTMQIALVGSRACTASGKETAQNIAADLTTLGVVITSGLAMGIDAFAHVGALKRDNSTVAVVATGLDIVYPSRHRKLATDILNRGGAIVSEFPPGTLPKPGHFPKRNRLISGLSQGVVVIEAALKSGSLITARTALEQNREVFAVPSAIYNEQAKGCHQLIKQGAKLVENVADIMEEFDATLISELNLIKGSSLLADKANNEGAVVPQKNNGVSAQPKTENKDLFIDPLLASVGYEITPIDIVVSRSQLPTDVVLTKLTMLELEGLVTSVPGGYLRL